MDDERGPDQAADPEGAAEPIPPSPVADAPTSSSPIISWAPSPEASAWEALAAQAGPPRIDVGSLFGRTLDTFLAGWRTFVVLGIPSAVTGILIQFLALDFRTPSNAGTGAVLALIAFPINIGMLLAMILAADDIRAGRPLSIGSAIGRGFSRALSTIGSAIVFFLCYCVLAIGVVVGLVLLSVIPSIGPILALVFGIAGFALVIYVLLRLSMFAAPIALDQAGPIEGLRASWNGVKGHLWRLGVLFVGLYLLIAPLAIGGAFLVIAMSPIVGAVISILVFLITGPILPIALSLAWGDLTGRPRTEQPVRSPRRALFAVAVLVGGIILLVPSVALAVPKFGELALAAIPEEDRGVLYFGTSRNPANPCAPLGPDTVFDSSDSIYIGGYFSRTLLPGQSATIHVYKSGQEVGTAPIETGGRAVACYYEPEPLVGAPSGIYLLRIEDAGGTLAEGGFTVR
jgi:hypothetical protein